MNEIWKIIKKLPKEFPKIQLITLSGRTAVSQNPKRSQMRLPIRSLRTAVPKIIMKNSKNLNLIKRRRNQISQQKQMKFIIQNSLFRNSNPVQLISAIQHQALTKFTILFWPIYQRNLFFFSQTFLTIFGLRKFFPIPGIKQLSSLSQNLEKIIQTLQIIDPLR